MTCEHVPLAISFDVRRLSLEQDGPIIAYTLEGNAFCQECSQEFRVFRIKLDPAPEPGALVLARPCTHENFATGFNVERKRMAFALHHVVSVAVACYDCGMRFKPLQFELEPVERETDIIIPTDAEFERIGKSVH